ncbi:MAG: BspA family leucine-rich repeat surface protein [Niabella sp.]
MKHFFLLLGVLLSFAAGAQRNFITKWVFQRASSSLIFSALTDDYVNYSWTTTSSPAGGSGRFSQPGTWEVVSLAIPIRAGDTLTLSMEPENLRRFYTGSGVAGAYAGNLGDVVQWGSVPWTSMKNAFQSCSNLNITATDKPDLSRVKDMSGMFDRCSSLTAPPSIESWDVSGVTNMEYMFFQAPLFNSNLGAWDLKALTNATAMFSNSGLSCENYSRTLKAWAENPNTAGNVDFTFQRETVYTNTAVSWRNSLIAKNWSISSDRIAVPGDLCYDMVLPVTFGNINVTLKNGSLHVNWITLTETGNSHFEIEASTDGKNFTIIGNVLSKAQAGNSSVPLHYEFIGNIQGPALAAMGILLFGAAGVSISRRKKYLLLALAAGIGLSISGCSKHGLSAEDDIRDIYVRIKQADEDGSFKFSKVVKAVRE